MTLCHRAVVVQMRDTTAYLYAAGREGKKGSGVQEKLIRKGEKSLSYCKGL